MGKNTSKINAKKKAESARLKARRAAISASPRQGSFEVQRPRVTDHAVLITVPVFADGRAGTPGGGTGKYDVVFVLGVPGIGSVSSTVDVSTLLNSGDSLLEGSAQDVEFQAPDGTSWCSCDMISNQYGRLAQVRVTLDAHHFAGANATAHDYVMPLLSQYAYGADVAIEVAATVITEQSTHVTQVSAVLIGAVQPVPKVAEWTMPDLRLFMSIYRDGLNASQPACQALSFYKIIEGAAGFHTNRVRAAKKVGAALPADPLAELVPAVEADLPPTTPWVLDLFTPYLGMTFAEVMAATKDTVRNAMAHLQPGMDLVVADRLEDVDACRKAVPILRYAARRIIGGEIAYATSQQPTASVPV